MSDLIDSPNLDDSNDGLQQNFEESNHSDSWKIRVIEQVDINTRKVVRRYPSQKDAAYK